MFDIRMCTRYSAPDTESFTIMSDEDYGYFLKGNPSEPDFDVFVELTNKLMAISEFDPELAKHVVSELRSTQDPSSHIVLVGTDGDFAVTIIHVDRATLGGEDGPVLFPTADGKTIFAAVSRELLEEKVQICEELPENLGDHEWEDFMEQMMAKVTQLHRENPKTI